MIKENILFISKERHSTSGYTILSVCTHASRPSDASFLLEPNEATTEGMTKRNGPPDQKRQMSRGFAIHGTDHEWHLTLTYSE